MSKTKPLSFSTVDVQQNVKCLCSQLRVLCVRWITAHLRLKPTLSLSLVILSKHKNLQKPGDDEKLMTNATVVASQAIKPSDIYEDAVVFLCFMVLWVRMVLSRFPRNPQIAIRGY